jgi:hypothetical protein
MQFSYAELMCANVQCLEILHQSAFALPANVNNQGSLKTICVEESPLISNDKKTAEMHQIATRLQ